MGELMNNKSSFRDERGTALIATIIFLMAMGILSTALIYTVQNEMRTSSVYKYSQQAVYVASAGVQDAVQWFQNTYQPTVAGANYVRTVSPVTAGGNPVLLAGQTGSNSNIGNTMKINGGPQIHFSTGCLQRNLVQRPFRMITWVQDSL
jgi:Tfp pilus assembly protein PilX